MLYKVRKKPWSLSGSKAIVFDPPAWCEVARILCMRDVETLPLVEKLLSGDGIHYVKTSNRSHNICIGPFNTNYIHPHL
jgi:hypothetical protein